jgi:hypothetical protein
MPVPSPQHGCDMLTSNGHRRVVVWINHHRAAIAVFVGSLPDGWMQIYGDGPRPEQMGDWLVYHVDSHPHEVLRDFHEAIARHLTPSDALLLLGPGQAKHQFARHIAQHGRHIGQVAHFETLVSQTETELIAFATSFFDAPPDNGSGNPRSERASSSE